MNRSQPLRAMKTVCRSVRLAVAAFALLLGAQGAWAACKRHPAFAEKIINMDMGRVVIPQELGVGAVIRAKQFPIQVTGLSELTFTCDDNGDGALHGVMLKGTKVPGYDHVFTTEVPGVGIRLSRVIGSGLSTVFYPHDFIRRDFLGDLKAGSQFQVELIKTEDNTGSGPLSSGTYTTYSGDDGSSAITTVLSGIGITIITPSCSVDLGSRNIPVEFGKVPQSNFKGRSTTTGDRKFNIKLNCRAGMNAQNTVYLRMDARPDPSNEQGVLKITQAGASTATGVGIQVIDNQSVPVKFNEEALVGPSKEGQYVLPYTARYFQTGDKVTPGRADGTATFTLDYK